MHIQQEKNCPVIVFGTTPDYVKKLFQRYPGKALFIVDQQFHDNPFLKDIDKDHLLFTDIMDSQGTTQAISKYLLGKKIKPAGMACYDCESLLTASQVATGLKLDFPSYNSVRLARNKIISKLLWSKAKIPCPRSVIASNLEEVLVFYDKLNNEIVLKPISSSGSELVFHCRSEQEIIDSVDNISEQLKTRRSNPFYRHIYNDSMDPCKSWVVEEYISGPEFSCDFILKDDQITILRTAGKVKDMEQPFGSILAYFIPPAFPEGLSYSSLNSLFENAVTYLGFKKGFFMADFIVREGKPFIIEVSPRPGGDSIPDLLEIATGIDILDLYLDFVTGRLKRPEPIPTPEKHYASINLYAPIEGTITEIDSSEIDKIPWVKGVFVNRKVSDQIVLPPRDYESRKIGHIIVEGDPSEDIVKTRQILQENLRLSIQTYSSTLAAFLEKRTANVLG